MEIKLRLMFRRGQQDGNGIFTGYEYKSLVIQIPSEKLKTHPSLDLDWDRPTYWEVIGGEWMKQEEQDTASP